MSAVKVEELMSGSVITVQPHHSVAHVREKMADKKLNNVPVVSPEGEPVGVAELVVLEQLVFGHLEQRHVPDVDL